MSYLNMDFKNLNKANLLYENSGKAPEPRLKHHLFNGGHNKIS